MRFFEAFGLKEDPFGVTPDPRYLYLGQGHREALASLVHGIETNRGFMALIAPPGMGKTTLLFRLLERMRATAETVFHFQTQCSAHELVRFVLADLGVNAPQGDMVALHQQFNRELLRRNDAGRRVVVVVDEAQNLGDQVLEAIRLLSDFETPQRKLMQIVLSGQQQLLVRLASAKQEQLRQRVSIVARLRPFSRQATANYIDHRLRIAGLKRESPFTDEALDLIAEHTKGVPRNINNCCFQAMSVAFGLERTQIDREVVEEVARDYELPMEMAPEEADPLASSSPGLVVPAQEAASQPQQPRAAHETRPAAQAPASPVPYSVSGEHDAFESLRAAQQHRRRDESLRSTKKVRRRALHVVRRNAPVALALAFAGMLLWWAWQLPLTSIAAPADSERKEERRAADEDENVPPQDESPPADDKVSEKAEPSPAQARPRPNSVRSPSRLQGAARTAPEPAATAASDPGISIGSSIPVEDDADIVVLPQTARPTASSPSDESAIPPSVPSSGSIGDLTPPVTIPGLAPSVSSGATPARLVRNRVPVYPAAARTLGIEGAVVLRVVIGETGRVGDVSVIRGNPILARAALEAVRDWHYEPAMLNGRPTELETTVTLNFKR